MAEPAAEDTVPWIAHDEFRDGLSRGRFRVVVNAALARRFVVRRTRVDVLAVLLIGGGALLALGGQPWGGLALVALGIAANRLVRRQAAQILLYLAARDAAVYAEAASAGVMEVRRSG